MAAIGIANAAYAETLASAPAYPGNPSGGTVTCRLFNAGLAGASITQRQIIDNLGDITTLSSDTCNVTLNPSKYCAFSTPATGNLAYSCRVVTGGIDENIRGEIDVIVSLSQFISLQLSK